MGEFTIIYTGSIAYAHDHAPSTANSKGFNQLAAQFRMGVCMNKKHSMLMQPYLASFA